MKNLLTVLFVLIFVPTIFANPGDLDTTFGVTGGYKVSDFLGLQSYETVNDVIMQSDGKIIIAGSITPAVNLTDFLVARYNIDGTLDTAFSGDGIFTLDFGGADEVHAIALQSDGKIVAVGEWGSSGSNFVFRLNSNGSLDTTFGGGTGRVQVVAGKAVSVAIQPSDGKIVIGGYTNLNEATICRLNPDSVLDTTFDTDGIAVFTQVIRANEVAIQPNGRIVFTGSSGGDTATARILSNGALDSSFNSSGVVITPIYAASNEGNAILIQSDGKILVSGGGDDEASLIRYNSNGSLDSTFDSNGIRLHLINSNGDNFYNDLVQQPDGKILAIGTITYGATALVRDSFTLSRFNTDGSFDSSFDGNGSAQSQWCEYATGMFLHTDGKIVAVGREYADTNWGTCTQRFNADGSVDSTFNPNIPNGKITQNFASVESIAGLPNGKIMVAGWDTNQTDFATLIRLNADGSLDTTFADEGVYQYHPSSDSTRFYDLKILNNGSFYVAGDGGIISGAILIKFDSSGNLDTTFSSDGIVTAGINASRFYSIAVQSDGKIFGCGSSGSGASTRNGKVVRYSTNGTFEISVFNSLNAIGGGGSEILDCAFQSAHLVVAGYSGNGANERLAISRHALTTLDIDTVFFGSGGYVIRDMSPTLNDRATDLVVQSDDKIVVSSTGLNGGGDRDFAVLRYEANGNIDQNFTGNFGTNGISLIDFGLNGPNDEANAVLVEPSNAIVVGGFSNDGSGDRFALSKLNADGGVRLGWGTLGRTISNFPNNDAKINALGLYWDGRILAAGSTWNGTDYDFAIARYQNEAGVTAATVSISGRASTAKGNGIRNIIVTLTNSNGTTLTAKTNSFGHFRFDGIAVGQTYFVSVSSKRFTFEQPTQIINVSEELANIDFIAEE